MWIAKIEKTPNWLELLKRFPRNLQEVRFAGPIWSLRETIEPKHRVLCRDLLLYMCDQAQVSAATLQKRWTELLGQNVIYPKKFHNKNSKISLDKLCVASQVN